MRLRTTSAMRGCVTRARSRPPSRSTTSSPPATAPSAPAVNEQRRSHSRGSPSATSSRESRWASSTESSCAATSSATLAGAWIAPTQRQSPSCNANAPESNPSPTSSRRKSRFPCVASHRSCRVRTSTSPSSTWRRRSPVSRSDSGCRSSRSHSSSFQSAVTASGLASRERTVASTTASRDAAR